MAGVMIASIFPAGVQASTSKVIPIEQEPGDSSGHLPNTPSNPSPANGATGISTDVTLSWNGGDADGDEVTYDIYFEANDNTPDIKVASGITSTSYHVSNLEYGTTYYWRINARDKDGSVMGPVWKFTTKESTVITIKVAIYNVSQLEGEYADEKGSEKWENTVTYGMVAALQGTWTYNGQEYKFDYTLVKYQDIVDGTLNNGDYKLFIAPGDYEYIQDQWDHRFYYCFYL